MTAYTPFEIECIAGWLKAGDSASKAAARLSAMRGRAVSRNAIIGIVHRNAKLDAIGFRRATSSPGSERTSTYTPEEIKLVADCLKAKKNYVQIAQRLALKSGRVISRFGVKSLIRRTPELNEIGFRGQKGRLSDRKKAAPGQLPGRLFIAATADIDRDPSAFDYLTRPAMRALAPQPHFAAMRFVDCLSARCRAPLSYDLEERPGPDMLCCGLSTVPSRPYCAYHEIRLTNRKAEFIAEAA
ncbi:MULTISPECIES: GcrA cell cycle regulator [unclassified Mesorhizobium]|uniref:GcrA cell cycle regulator n=1 Tax=unclassified Mesorhizobium TaxID=325217 RepID=UPI00112ED89B|nr:MULTISPECIES: GcrA cell cycle regulator [unclassified Mesorhizobium]TPK42282.1 GcrA cell cycle regulator [Mesorhizobium sp. B2-5-2]TPL44523.1 GcrA cell cycle regulator [Mesorhizobium sp. B2-4-5]TPM68710.1 GcrA cell cycle regulator [Mesorhizobium sp. B2-1-6]TPN71730.1 GcrA cell cycle regulator [Mesorhizobium sp. B1-1-2]